MPVRIAQNNVGGAIRPLLIGCMEEPPQIWLDSQRIEVISTREVGPRRRRSSVGINSHGTDDHRCNHALEGSIPVAQIQIIRVGLRRSLHSGKRPLDRVNILCLRHIQRSQDERVQNAEDDGVRANAQRQGEDSR